VVFASVAPNQYVEKGDTLLVVEDPVYHEKWQLLQQRINRTTIAISDIKNLLSLGLKIKTLHSREYTAAYNIYKHGLHDLQLKLQKATKDFDRNAKLYAKGIISKVDYEAHEHEQRIARNNISQWKRQHANQWEAKHAEYQQILEELLSSQQQLSNSRGNNVLVAPAAGTLLEVVGLNTNGFVQAGQPIAKLSPDSNLVVECYVAPADIGYVQEGKKVAFKIDAYNYNQWGLAQGTVSSIGDDIELLDGKPAFTLRCQIDTPTLRLKNGVEGTLKKGMTLTTQFVLTRRSLFDLLYDNLNDWLNPAEKHE
jgi:multidrug resistance efflux pump